MQSTLSHLSNAEGNSKIIFPKDTLGHQRNTVENESWSTIELDLLSKHVKVCILSVVEHIDINVSIDFLTKSNGSLRYVYQVSLGRVIL